jgi:hypothetical protein
MSISKDRGWIATARVLHSGVKGMKWGVRKERSATSVSVQQRGKKLKAKGGEHHPASSEAIKTKRLGQIAKKSGFQALTNAELQAYNNRLNLEANAKRLDYQNKPAAQKFVASLLGQTGKNAAQQAANEVASKQVKKLLVKGAVAAI